MTKFKVGDRVERIVGYHMGMKVGDVGTISKISGNPIISINLHEYEGAHSITSFQLVKENTMKKATITRNWSFESRAEQDIDFEKIYNELSHTNPIALVEAQYTHVVIHKTLLTKSVIVNIPLPSETLRHSGFNNTFRLFDKPTVIVEWAKKVKDASWPEKVRNKATVTVNLLNI